MTPTRGFARFAFSRIRRPDAKEKHVAADVVGTCRTRHTISSRRPPSDRALMSSCPGSRPQRVVHLDPGKLTATRAPSPRKSYDFRCRCCEFLETRSVSEGPRSPRRSRFPRIDAGVPRSRFGFHREFNGCHRKSRPPRSPPLANSPQGVPRMFGRPLRIVVLFALLLAGDFAPATRSGHPPQSGRPPRPRPLAARGDGQDEKSPRALSSNSSPASRSW